jgi:phage tail P2-like protein
MKLTDCKFERLLPLFMRGEADDLAFARTLDPTIREIGEKVRLCSDWGVVDDLPEEFLDALAWELDAEWYDKTAEIEVKRALIKSADKVHAHHGTKSAVAQVVADYYGEAVVMEWFEYGGEPGHFKVSVSGMDVHVTIPEEFLNAVNRTKRQSAIMDDVDFTWVTYETINAGAGEKGTLTNPDIIMEGII